MIIFDSAWENNFLEEKARFLTTFDGFTPVKDYIVIHKSKKYFYNQWVEFFVERKIIVLELRYAFLFYSRVINIGVEFTSDGKKNILSASELWDLEL